MKCHDAYCKLCTVSSAHSNNAVSASTQPLTAASSTLIETATAQPVTVTRQLPPAGCRHAEYNSMRRGQANLPRDIQAWRQKAKLAIEMAAASIGTGAPHDSDTSFLHEMLRSTDYFPRNEAKKFAGLLQPGS